MDLRTKRTKHSIINAFIQLRSQKPLEKITIKELSEIAYINKATFYSHYKDIYDLSEQLEEEVISSILKNIPHPDSLITNPKQGVEELTVALSCQNELFHILFSDTRSSILIDRLEHGLKKQIYDQYPEFQNQLEWDILLSFLIQGGFHAFLAHSNNNIWEITRILGDIQDSLIKIYIPTRT